jgi:hypothetical protein
VEMNGIEDREEKRIRLSKADQIGPLFVPRWKDLGSNFVGADQTIGHTPRQPD